MEGYTNMIGNVKTRYHDEFCYYETDQIIGNDLCLYGEYAQIEVDSLLSILTNDAVVYDIGGNIGYHATAFGSVAKKVYTFEPNHRTYSLLIKNIAKFPNVYSMHCAVGAKTGIIKCMDYDPSQPANFGSVRITNAEYSHWSAMEPTGEVPITAYIKTIPVPVIAIDELELEPPTLIKIDVEGSELGVITGCLKTISQYKPVIYYEAHELTDSDFTEIYNLIKPYDYNMYWCIIPNYNADNYKGAEESANSTRTYTVSVIALPPHINASNLLEVLGPDDSLAKLKSRIADSLASQNSSPAQPEKLDNKPTNKSKRKRNK